MPQNFKILCLPLLGWIYNIGTRRACLLAQAMHWTHQNVKEMNILSHFQKDTRIAPLYAHDSYNYVFLVRHQVWFHLIVIKCWLHINWHCNCRTTGLQTPFDEIFCFIKCFFSVGLLFMYNIKSLSIGFSTKEPCD